MQEIVKCFEPFSQATNLLSGQEYPTSSLIKVVNQDLENNCEENDNDSGIIKEMKILMRQKLATRNVRECAQKLINVSCILDPRFKQVIDHSDTSIIELFDKVVELHNITTNNNVSEMSQSQIPGTQSQQLNLLSSIAVPIPSTATKPPGSKESYYQRFQQLNRKKGSCWFEPKYFKPNGIVYGLFVYQINKSQIFFSQIYLLKKIL